MRTLIGILILSLFASPATCQFIQSDNYTLYENLSRGLIKAVTIDHIGFVWVATDEGLIRFDGKQALFFKNELKGGFAKGFLKRAGKPLLVVHDYGVTEIISQPDTTYFHQILSGTTVDSDTLLFFPKTLYESRDKSLWIGENQAIVRYYKGKIKKYRFREGTDGGSIYSIYRSFSMVEDELGHLWVISFSGDLYYFDNQKDKFIEVSLDLPLNRISFFIKTDKNNYWIGGQQGIYEISLSYRAIKSCQKISDLKDISCGILIDNECYVGTWTEGLYKRNIKGGLNAFEKINTLPFKDVLGLAHDLHNGLWVVGSEKVASLAAGFFKEVPLQEPTVAIEVLSILPNGTIVVGTWQNFYFIKRNKERLKDDITVLPIHIAPTALFCDTDRLWIGTLDGSVYSYKLEGQQLERLEAIPATSNPIAKILKDQQGNIWVSGNKPYGLVQIRPNRQVEFHKNKGLAESRTIHLDKSGVLFVGGTDINHYLYCYFPPIDSFVNLSVPLNFDVKGNFAVTSIATTPDGALWLGTSHGLLKYNFAKSGLSENKITRITLEKVPTDESIKSLYSSNDGTLWVATPSGLIAFDEGLSLLYDQSSGLPSINLTTQGLALDFDNNLWVGTSKGLALFQQNQYRNSLTPSPIFTALKVNGIKQRLTAGSPMVFSLNSNIEITYLALSFPSDKLQYQSRLIGKDTLQWTSPSNQNTLSFSSLSPGKYILEVKAQQHGGFLWSDVTTLTFVIKSAWYQKWWALLLFIGGFVLLVIAIAKIYSWQLIQQKKRLEAMVAVRTEEVKLQQKHILEQKEKYRLLKEKQLNEQIEYKNKQLTIYTLHLIQKNESLKELQLEINKILRQPHKKDKAELRNFLSIIDYSFRKDEEWEKFRLYFENVHARFFENLLKEHPTLTPQELRLCALIRLNLSMQEIATILGISAESVKTARFRLRKKMELPSHETLVDHIMLF